MSSFALRVKSKSGQHLIRNLKPNSTIKELKKELSEITQINTSGIQVLCGYPPKLFDTSNENQTLTASGLTSGETLIIEEKMFCDNRPDINDHINEQGATGILLKKVVPADNSCLFSSLYFVLNRKTDGTREAVQWFRDLVAETISKDTDNYCEAILGKPVSEYCSWIKEPTSWGGAIELSVLSNHYGIEIAVVDTVNGIINRFGEDQKYPLRVFLMFDGIHYDPLFMESDNNAEIMTMFETEDHAVLQNAEQLAKEAKSSRQFTDVNKFTLKCLVCGANFIGQAEARDHAVSTGHANFGEY